MATHPKLRIINYELRITNLKSEIASSNQLINHRAQGTGHSIQRINDITAFGIGRCGVTNKIPTTNYQILTKYQLLNESTKFYPISDSRTAGLL